MECREPITDGSSVEFMRRFNRKTTEHRIPVCGNLELTHRCNLRCRHCYARNAAAGRELSTGEVLSILDQCQEAGCLFLLLTGGEALIRPDFETIYTAAKNWGFLVTVFTNGTLITDRTIALWKDLPPHEVEISLYGATDRTCDLITGVDGSFRKCVVGIERLLNCGVKLGIKTVLMRQNSHEFEAIERIAKQYGVRFRFDACLFSKLDGDHEPLTFRVPPEEAVALEFADPDRAQGWVKYYDKQEKEGPYSGLYGCGAGITAFHVDPYGCLFPCLMVRGVRYDLRSGTFADGWRRVVDWIDGKKVEPGFPCAACDRKALCGYCPGYFEFENGSEMAPSEYLCQMGKHRMNRILKERSLHDCAV